VTGSSDGTLKIWELDTGNCMCTLNAHHGGVSAGALVFQDTLLLSGGADGTIRLWRFPSGEMLKAVAMHTGRVRALAVLSGGKLAASGGYDRHVKVWTLDEGEQVAAFATDSPVIALACSPDSRTIVAGDAQGSVHFLRLENNV
jgi:WD40 repeat protein